MKKYLPHTFFFRLLTVSTALVLAYGALDAFAEKNDESFLPTWRLMNQQEKQQFISGYLQGWRDAAKVTEIVLEHVEKNPDDAVRSLKTVRSLYDLSRERPTLLAKGIDDFYSDPDNAKAALSKAVTASRDIQR